MAVQTKARGVSKYQKAEVIKQLEDVIAAVERATKTHDEAFAEWKANAPAKFARWVENVKITDTFYQHALDDIRPPVRSQLCQDWRVQAVQRSLLRIRAMDGDVVSISVNDPIWEQVGYAACL